MVLLKPTRLLGTCWCRTSLQSFGFKCPTHSVHLAASWRLTLTRLQRRLTVMSSSVTQSCYWRSTFEYPDVIFAFSVWICDHGCHISIVQQLKKMEVMESANEFHSVITLAARRLLKQVDAYFRVLARYFFVFCITVLQSNTCRL